MKQDELFLQLIREWKKHKGMVPCGIGIEEGKVFKRIKPCPEAYWCGKRPSRPKKTGPSGPKIVKKEKAPKDPKKKPKKVDYKTGTFAFSPDAAVFNAQDMDKIDKTVVENLRYIETQREIENVKPPENKRINPHSYSVHRNGSKTYTVRNSPKTVESQRQEDIRKFAESLLPDQQLTSSPDWSGTPLQVSYNQKPDPKPTVFDQFSPPPLYNKPQKLQSSFEYEPGFKQSIEAFCRSYVRPGRFGGYDADRVLPWTLSTGMRNTFRNLIPVSC